MRTTPPTLRDNNVRTSEWSRLLQRSGDRANARCNETGAGPPPRTAFCIAGAARSFSAPLMQAALWNHLIRACNLHVTSNLLSANATPLTVDRFASLRRHRCTL